MVMWASVLLHNHKSKSFGYAIEHTIVQHHTTNPPLCFITNQICQTTGNISFGLGQLQNVSFDISGSDPSTNYWLIVATYRNGDTDDLNRTRYVLMPAEIFLYCRDSLNDRSAQQWNIVQSVFNVHMTQFHNHTYIIVLSIVIPGYRRLGFSTMKLSQYQGSTLKKRIEVNRLM